MQKKTLKLFLPSGQKSAQMYNPDRTIGEVLDKLYQTRCAPPTRRTRLPSATPLTVCAGRT